MKCRYSHCRQESKEVSKEEAVKIGGAYYHKECALEKKNIEEIVKLFKDKIDPHVVMPLLRKIINTIVLTTSSDFLLFSVKWIIKNKPGLLRHPGGLNYIIKNEEVIREYKKYKANIVINNTRNNEVVFEETEYKYRFVKQPSFEDLLFK